MYSDDILDSVKQRGTCRKLTINRYIQGMCAHLLFYLIRICNQTVFFPPNVTFPDQNSLISYHLCTGYALTDTSAVKCLFPSHTTVDLIRIVEAGRLPSNDPQRCQRESCVALAFTSVLRRFHLALNSFIEFFLATILTLFIF